MMSAGAHEQLYGTWRLVSWRRELLDTGEAVEAFGKAPCGFLNYGRDGRVFFIMAKENRAKPADLPSLTDQERVELYNSMIAYAGTFAFDGETATHKCGNLMERSLDGQRSDPSPRVRRAQIDHENRSAARFDGKRVVGVFNWERLP